jgi:integrase/recombinase XerD
MHEKTPPADDAPSAALATRIHAPGGVSMALPATIAGAGDDAARATFEFFTARVHGYTRIAYARAVARFCAWLEAHGVPLRALPSPTVAAYLEQLQGSLKLSSVKLHAAALRHWLDFLTEKGVLPNNPASSVRTPRMIVREGKTPVLEREEARRLFASLEPAAADGDVLALRDRAMFALMLYGLVRVGAVARLRVRDFEDGGGDTSLTLHEKGHKMRRIPVHHLAAEYLRAYLTAARLEAASRAPLFQTAPRRSGALSGKAMTRGSVLEAVKRRCHGVGLSPAVCCHSFRATGITLHQEAGGRLEDAAELAGHASTQTTRLYSRASRKVQRKEVERIQL